MSESTHTKVIAGPAGHFYALTDFEGQPALLGFPMDAEGGKHDQHNPPQHPDVSGDWDGWYDITDPAPETNVDALVAELTAA